MLAIFVVFNTALADLHMTVEAKGELNETETLQETKQTEEETIPETTEAETVPETTETETVPETTETETVSETTQKETVSETAQGNTVLETAQTKKNIIERNKEILPEADAFLYSQTANGEADKNYGSVSSENLKEGSGVYNRRMILKFNLNETGSFNSGLLKINMVKGDAPINPEGDEVKLYAISNDWTESEVTYNNQPELGELVATTIVTNPVGWYTWDITSYLKEHQEEGTVSFMLIGTNVNRMLNYRESGEKTSPRIILDTDETAPQ